MGRPHTERLGAAIAGVLAAADLKQTELARRLRARGHMVDQSRISKWIRGVDVPNDIFIYGAIEDEAGARRGAIFRAAGLVEDADADVIAVINGDPRLDEMAKRILTTVYSEFVNRSPSTESALERVPSAALNASQ